MYFRCLTFNTLCLTELNLSEEQSAKIHCFSFKRIYRILTSVEIGFLSNAISSCVGASTGSLTASFVSFSSTLSSGFSALDLAPCVFELSSETSSEFNKFVVSVLLAVSVPILLSASLSICLSSFRY